ncbi:DUF4157 domain-containing protein [Nannocystis pusilla]|uniref:eCIS core domain-containing protein n=1 Tax=Nannocystis pusilla TaxID=889268 RepID=UPI003B785755
MESARPGAVSPIIRRQVSSNVNLWRACAKCDDEERQAHRPGGQAKGLIQRRCDTCDQGAQEASATTSEVSGARPTLSPSVRNALFRDMRTSGEPLDSATRQFMEPRFRRDFSRVRIHRTSASSELAETLNARAFTIGRDVFFGRNEYQPSTQTGKRLLAHELTHTLQQGSGASISRARIQRAPASDLSESLTPALGSSPGPTAEASSSDCPARDPDERLWAREQPLRLDYELMPSRFGHDLRVWTLTGFPIDSTFPGPTQGDVISLLLPLFKRLHYLGTALDDQANRGQDILTSGMEPPRCAKLYRSVRVFGVGDCHNPERNVSLKKGRAAFLELIWPASLRGLFRRGDGGMARKDEARFGEFPAGSNATREARAQNRGVVLVEDFRAEEYPEWEHQDALARRQFRTDAVFPRLYREALDTIPDGIRKCILSKVRFAGGRPIDTARDQYILDRNVHKVFVGRRVLTSNHVGASVYSMARSWNIMGSETFGSPESICGDKGSRPASLFSRCGPSWSKSPTAS